MGAFREGEEYVSTGGRRLRRGYTTGTCATAATRAAAMALLSGGRPESIEVETPKGIFVRVPVEALSVEGGKATCAVRKDGGDDADDTNGMLICAEVERIGDGISIDGGEGVGRVTRKGLDQPVGNAAINRVPRAMIKEAAEREMDAAGYDGGLRITITAPEGGRVASRTFNPRLGIVGGVSILGTSGIVEPMSEDALIGSIRAEARMFLAQDGGRRYLLAVPGNYGRDFVAAYPALNGVQPVECSNYVGGVIDIAREEGAAGVLLVGNLGKLVKVAGGIMNTHSRNADCRMEILAANAAMAGADAETVKRVMGCVSTDDALDVLGTVGLMKATMDTLIPKIEFHMDYRAKGTLEVGAVVFSSKFGVLGETPSAEKLVRKVGERE